MLMRKNRTNAGASARPLRAVAGALLVLFMLMAAFAASPALHRSLHADADQPNHHCAITVLAQGQIDVPPCDAVACELPAGYESVRLIELSSFYSAFDLLPPGRAPPVVLA